MQHTKGSRSSARLSDEELEYYGNLYIQHGIRNAGVEFENYLSNPEYWLDRHTGRRWRGEAVQGDGRREGLAAYLRLRRAPRNGNE
jgi:hypothetical protein